MRLRARPPSPDRAPTGLAPGTTTLRLANGTEGLLHVPPGAVRGLVVALHGAGGQGRAALGLLRADADRLGLVVLAPSSAGSTWTGLFARADAERAADPDTAALDAALVEVFGQHRFDPARVALAGFSDGASYAISLGLANGDLVTRVVAFSPGFENAGPRTGRPSFFLTHGTQDRVLPIERTSRRLVPTLRRDGYDVTYVEFDDGHVVPPQLAASAADWLLT